MSLNREFCNEIALMIKIFEVAFYKSRVAFAAQFHRIFILDLFRRKFNNNPASFSHFGYSEFLEIIGFDLPRLLLENSKRVF